MKMSTPQILKIAKWTSRAGLGLAIATDVYILGKTGHLWAPGWFLFGVNTSSFFYSELLNRGFKREDGMEKIILHQQAFINKLYRIADGEEYAIRKIDEMDPHKN